MGIMRCSVFLMILIFSLTVRSLRAQPRCVPFADRIVPMSCEMGKVFNVDDPSAYGNINESEMFPPHFKQTLDNLLIGTSSESGDHDSCVQLIREYFCGFYYPLCDLETGIITPVCSSSCNMIFNNEHCSNLLMDAIRTMEQQNITEVPSGESCEETFVPLTNTPEPAVSHECIDIASELDNPIPLTYEVTPVECAAAVRSTHYAPGAPFTDDNPNDTIDEIMRISQIPGMAMCAELINILNCIITYPVCEVAEANEARLRPICESQCEEITNQLTQCLMSLPEGEFPLVTDNIFSEVKCYDPESYYNFPEQYILDSTNNAECLRIALPLNTGLPPTSPNSDTDGSSDDTLIIVGVVLSVVIVAAVLIAILLVLVLLRKRRRRDGENHTVKIFTKSLHTQESEPNFRYVSTQRRKASPGGKNNSLKSSNNSLHTQINNFLQHVKEKFSEVLLPVEDVTKLELIGKGAFGMVHKGKLVMPDSSVKAVAIKTIKSGSLDAMKDLVAESAIMKTFHHPNVLPLLGVCIDYDDEDALKIVIPFMANGDLRNFLKNNRVSQNNTHEYPKNIPEKLLKKMCLDIAKGMEYLAERRFVHRDLAARNCMVDEKLSIKVADFGLARDIYTTEYYRMNQHTIMPVKWMAFEALLDGYFDEKTDMWSYGVTCWEIFSLGRIPYPGVDNADVISLLKSGKRLEQPELCSSKMYEMINSTWHEEPEKRPSFTDIVNFLHKQNAEEASVDKAETTFVETKNDSSYLDLS